MLTSRAASKEEISMNNKPVYEEVKIEIILLNGADIITSSSAFDGEEDRISEWSW